MELYANRTKLVHRIKAKLGALRESMEEEEEEEEEEVRLVKKKFVVLEK